MRTLSGTRTSSPAMQNIHAGLTVEGGEQIGCIGELWLLGARFQMRYATMSNHAYHTAAG